MATRQDQTAEEIDKAWQRLREALARVPPERMDESGAVGVWSAKDLIGHITTWENEAINAIQRYLQQRDLDMLAWPAIDQFNELTVKSKRPTPLADLLVDFEMTHEKTVELVRSLTAEALNVPEVEKRIRIDTFAHYAEHSENILSWLGQDASA